MAIKLIANYSKRLGLPGYSSHQFSVSVETELVTTGDVARESLRLYQLLQTSVDEQIQQTGFVPPDDYGMVASDHLQPSNPSQASGGARWKCTAKQRELIESLVSEHHLDKGMVDRFAVDRFGKGVRSLDKMEASGLIDELIETHGGQQRPANGRRSAYARQ